MRSELELQAAFITGQSDPASCALSPAQTQFLRRLCADGVSAVPRNFPYRDTGSEFRPTPLLRAACNNARQHLRSRQAAFAAAHRASVETLLAGAAHTIFLAGSCGLELLANLALDDPWPTRFSVFAYGPGARARPACRLRMIVRGRRDWLSRAYAGTTDRWTQCGHLDYLERDDVLAHCREFVRAVVSALRQAPQAEQAQAQAPQPLPHVAVRR